MMKLFESIRHRYKRWDRRLTMTKRQQFVIITLVLSVGLILTQLMPDDYRYPATVVLSLLTYMCSAFGLREDLNGIEWLTLLTLPTLFTAAVALFYFLLPGRWLTRVPFVLLYGIGMYALLLTENIYNVAADRTIALLRAAHSVGFLITLVTYFLLIQTVMAFRFSFALNTVLVGVISFLLVIQTLWASVLEDHMSSRVFQISLVIAITLAQLSWIFSFWPTQSTLKVLLFTTSFYGAAGMAQQYLIDRLYKKTVIEFFVLCSIVCVIVVITTQWHGIF